MVNFVPNSLIYFDVSQKIIGKSKIKNKERVINNNFEEYSNKKKTIHIKRKGINAKILLILVFFAVKIFKP
tara:strand:- start:14 stop:226 length:213 start_codon:yes stop_codon:yes gene_type:complete